jgi:DNA-binding transcriptional LysR family regulator
MNVIKSQNLASIRSDERMKNLLARGSRRYDSHPFHISLKQWRMLHAVVDCDGFRGAANRLHISQSAISYSIAKLQEQLGIPVLRIEGRKARITEEGKALLELSRNLISEALEIETIAEGMRQGRKSEIQSEIHLAVDDNFPVHVLMRSIRKFSEVAQNVKVTLDQIPMHEADKALQDGTVDLVIGDHVPSAFTGEQLIEVEYIAVAHPAHALFMLGRNVRTEDLRRHVQIANSGSTAVSYVKGKNRSFGVVKDWNVRSVDAAVAALCQGLGYAWLPKHCLKYWLDSGELRVLPVDEGFSFKTSLYLIRGRFSRVDFWIMKFAELLHHVSAADAMDDHMNFKLS